MSIHWFDFFDYLFTRLIQITRIMTTTLTTQITAMAIFRINSVAFIRYWFMAVADLNQRCGLVGWASSRPIYQDEIHVQSCMIGLHDCRLPGYHNPYLRQNNGTINTVISP